MKITRDVVYDLLPAYFANELSADSRALIEEFFASDPEFGRMAERFRALMAERAHPGTDTAADRERTSFDRLRKRATLRQAAVFWSFAALLSLGAFTATSGRFLFSLRNPGVIISITWALVAAGCWLWLFLSRSRRQPLSDRLHG